MYRMENFDLSSKIMKKGFTLLVIILTCSLSCQSQSPYVKGITPPSYASPNAASLGKYGDIPVSFHTGTPEISIPIYTVSQGGLNLPISLSYHSSGIRVSELASWVGLGWSLNAGGVITRTVHGGPDDGYWSSSEPKYSDLAWGWYRDGGIPNQIIQCQNNGSSIPQQSLVNGPNSITVPGGAANCCYFYYLDASRGLIDLEPDLYTFNFNGHAGKFFFDESRKIHMFPEEDFYIKPVTDVSGKFDGWEITSSDGIKYFFGTSVATEISKNDPSGSFTFRDNLTTTSWYLYKITSPNDEDQINLYYADEVYSYGNRGGQSFIIKPLGGYLGNNITTTSSIPSITSVSGKRLSQITTSSGNTIINFSGSIRQDVSSEGNLDVVNTSAQSLDVIQISSRVVCKNFTLSHSYPMFTGNGYCLGCPNSLIDATRIILNSVQESDCNGISISPYSFNYNSIPLPRRYSLARDKWDFYNGANNQSQIPNDLVDPVIGNIGGTADRSVNSSYLQAGILTKIKYPTGGFSNFYYEPHRENSTSALIGGLRVNQIINDDGLGNIRTRIIQYGQGILYNGMPIYLQYPDNNNQKSTNAIFGTLVSASPIQAMWSTQGYHIGYSDVTETENGNGKTVYHYLNSGPLGHPNPVEFPLRELIAGFGSSDLVEKDIYRESEITPVAKEQYSRAIGNSASSIKARKVSNVGCIGQSGSCPFDETNNLYNDYYIYSNRFYLYSSDVTKDGVTVHTDYEYGLNLNSPTAKVVTNSKREILRTEWNYPITNNSGAPVEMYDPVNSNFKNMIGIPIEQREYRNGSIISKVQNNFTSSNGKILLSQTKEFPSGSGEFRTTDYIYNNSLRLSQVNKSIGTKDALIWGYNNQYAIAQVKNASQNEIFYEGFEGSFTGTTQGGRTGSYSGTNYSNTLTDLTANKAYILSYWLLISGKWQFQTQQVVLSPSTTQYSISLTGQVDDIRFYPIDSQMNTYTFDLGNGVNSVTDTNNLSSFYVYDELGRIKLVKDNKGNILKQYKYHYKEQ